MRDDNSPSLPRPVDNSPGLSRQWAAIPGEVEELTIRELIELLSDHDKRLFACECAERVLPIFEAEYPDDGRPRKAVETARHHLNGDATDEELKTAAGAARESVRSATGSEWSTAVWKARSRWASEGWAARAAVHSGWPVARWTAAATARAAARAAGDPHTEREWQHDRLVGLVLAARVNANS